MEILKSKKNKIIALIISITIILNAIPTINVKANITGNDTPVTAYEITSLPFKADVEVPENTTAWFKIELSKDTSLNFKYNGTYRYYKIYTEEEIFKDEPQYIVQSNYSGNLCYKLLPGTYYIQLRNYYSGSYTHTVNIEEILEDSNENNDVWERATEVNFGEDNEGNISAFNDVDWYKVSVPKKGVLRLSQSSNTYLRGEIYSSKNKEEAIYKNNSLYTSTGFKVEAGEYYIKVFYNENSYLNDIYKIRFDFYEDDIYEDNETPENAKLMPLDKDITINLQSMDDEDWFKIEVGDEGATLRLDLIGQEDSYADMYLYSEDILTNTNSRYLYSEYFGKPWDGSGYTNYNKEKSYKLSKGTYYLKFKAIGLYYSSCNYYEHIYDNTMTIRASLINDEFENNDSRENAKTLKFNSEATIILDAEDEDWFKIEVPEPGILNVEFKLIDENINNSIESAYYCVYKEGEENIFNGYNSYFTRENNNFLLDKGVYYIKLKSNHDRLMVSFKNTFTPTKIPYNGDVDNAYEVKIGEQVELISAINISSWVKFNVEETQQLNIMSSFYWIDIYTYEDGNLRRYYDSTYNPGTYYVNLQVRSKDDIPGGKGNFLIQNDAYSKVPTVSWNGYEGESTYPRIKLTFSHVMDTKTLNDDNIKLYRNNEEVQINYEFYKDTKQLIITPVNRLNYDTEYKVFISDKVRSLETGNKMAYEFERTFKTGVKPTIPEEPVKEGRLLGYLNLPKELSALSRAAEIVITGDGYKKYLYLNQGKIFDVKLPEGEYEVRVIIPTMLECYKTVTITQGYDSNVELIPISGDINGDNIIDIFDIAKLAINYNMSGE